MRRLTLLAALALGSAGCGMASLLPRAAPIDHLDPGATPPPGGNASIESVTLADDGTTLVLGFTGGRPFDREDPCSTAYVGWAAVDAADGDLLHASVIDVTPRSPLPDGTSCDAVGHPRVVNVALEEAFAGERVVDDSVLHEATTWFLRPPDDLAVMPALPDGWRLAFEETLPESPGGRWARTFVAPGVDPVASGPDGRLVVIQGFGEAAGVGGGPDERDVTVNGTPASLSREPATGELVLVWRLGADGLGLVASESDFSAAELIRVAEGVRAP